MKLTNLGEKKQDKSQLYKIHSGLTQAQIMSENEVPSAPLAPKSLSYINKNSKVYIPWAPFPSTI